MGGLTAPAAGPAWLAQLAPDRAPPPPGWWPPAPGWWLLGALVLVLGVLALVFGRRVLRALRGGPRALRRRALREIGRLEQTADDAALARELEHLMRRYAVARFGRSAVAQLSGEAWLAFAVDHGAADWAGETGRALLRAAYGGAASADRSRWLAGARAFVAARPAKGRPAESGPAQPGFAQSGPAQPGPTPSGPTQARPTQGDLATVGPVKAGP